MKISSKYNWLSDIKDAPKALAEIIKLGKLDTAEIPGPKSNREIMALAKEAGVEKIYRSDETAWCGVCETAICIRTDGAAPFTGYDCMRAKSFEKYGKGIPFAEASLCDTLVFVRFDKAGRIIGYHVGRYIGEDATCFHVAAGNQSNQYNIIRITKERCIAVRRKVWKIAQPAGVKKIFLEASGSVSDNEA